ncbi:MAG: imidazoleglycerol-phosphate dehydratase, partial [Chloroflexota bacterium]
MNEAHRIAELRRETRETQVAVRLDLDGTGAAEVDTGVPFFDHMLDQLARHGLFDLTLHCRGDLQIDTHHSVEDCGLLLGRAFGEALGDRAGIRRMGHALVPMDEALA